MSDLRDTPPNHRRLLEKAMAHASTHQTASAPKPPDMQTLAGCFPDYEILEQIGTGGMGTVFKATQTNLQRPVAIKILTPQLAVLARSSIDMTKPYPGQSIDVFVRAYGPAIKTMQGTRTTELTFANGITAVVHNGMVAGTR